MEYRIEDLARAAGVAVDTIRFYQGQGLIEAPRRAGRVTWYQELHLERIRRIRELQQRGFTLTVIRRFLQGELEPSDEALVEAVTAGPDQSGWTLDELAQRSQVAAPILRRLAQAGLLEPVGDRGQELYSPGDLEAIEAGLKLVDAGIPLTDLLELGARHATSVAETARTAVELFDRHVREPIQASGGLDADAQAELLESFERLLQASATLVRHHFKRALLRAARERIERAE